MAFKQTQHQDWSELCDMVGRRWCLLASCLSRRSLFSSVCGCHCRSGVAVTEAVLLLFASSAAAHLGLAVMRRLVCCTLLPSTLQQLSFACVK